MLRQFIKLNASLCNSLERLLPENFTRSLLYLHEQTVAREMNSRSDQDILDIGGGHLCPFANHRNKSLRTDIISIDILEDQLIKNQAADFRIAANVCGFLPLKNESVNIVVTRSVMEHLDDNRLFLAECHRVLRAAGRAIHVFPCKFAPFAIINQLLPNRIARSILFYFFPEWGDECGFKAYYKDCFYPRIVRLLRSQGFDIEEIHFRYYQSIYYKFFFPLYVCFLVYDLALWAFNVKLLCSQILVVARKQ